MINVIAPINPLGYGIAGLNITKQLINITDVALWVIGQAQLDSQLDADALSKAAKNTALFDIDAPCLKIWHQHDMAMFVGRGERIGFPIFELDSFNEVEKHNLNSLDRIFVCSQWAKDIVLKDINISENKVNVVPLGVDSNLFQPSESKSTKTIFFNCGKWEIRKGHDILVNIFNKAFNEDDDVELWMMTTNPFLSPEEDQQWKNLYLNSKLGDKIKFIDRVATHNEVYNIMRRTDCGIFPSKAEGWNLELLEMLSCGKTVITTNYTAHTEFCTDENAYLVNIKDKEPAYDGKWFNGDTGSWAKISDTEIDLFVDYMRDVHNRKCNNKLGLNENGVKTAKSFSWANSASTIKEIING
jgi:glycosyltransferase involved in cell wall biosynthesis